MARIPLMSCRRYAVVAPMTTGLAAKAGKFPIACAGRAMADWRRWGGRVVRAGFLRAGVMVIAASLLGACATGDAALTTAATPAAGPPPPSPGDWKFERRADRVAGNAVTTAYLLVRSKNARTASRRPALIQFASLQLMCFKSEPIVRLHFNYRVGANRSAAVAYRFDEKPGRDLKARFLADFQTIVIENKAEVMAFVEELAASSTLFMRVDSLIVGPTSAEFRVQGAPAAIEAAFAECPLPAASRKRAGA